jgi:aspartate carbamoyltransferase regulatory subunit
MQFPRRRKSQLLSISITLILALIIATIVAKPPVNYGLIVRSSAHASSVSNSSSSNNNLTKSAVVVRTNRTYYIDTNTKSKIQLANLENRIHSDNKNNNSSDDGIFHKAVNIALIAPTFTAAAYDDNSFYTFYKLYSNTPAGTNITSNLNLLSRTITDRDILSASVVMLELVDNLKLISPNSHITILTDADVDNGSLFSNNNNNIYDVAVLGHQEYVTQQEYDNMKKFVTNGGTMMLLDGNVFFVEVKYNAHTKTESLVKGHWWAFNGKSAWHSIGERWPQETSQWVGSNYLCYRCVSAFGNDPFEYTPHEEQYISNHNDSILLNYDAVLTTSKNKVDSTKQQPPTIATYELDYQKGKVVGLGIFSDDVIGNTTFNKFFDNLLHSELQ